MEFSIATLLSHLTDDKLVTVKMLEKKLDCQDEESLAKLEVVLDVLERIGVVAKERGKYRRIYEDDIVEAKLRCSSKGFCFAIQDVEDADDIYIRESHLSNAWNGDRVLVKIIKEGTRRRSPEGEVKVILERANPSLLAKILRNNGGYRAVPLDDRLLFELDLKLNGQDLESAVEHLVHVSVMRYPLAQNPPLGKVTRILGSDAEAAADTDIVCCKHDLIQEFAPEAIAEAEKLSPQISAEELEKREDLRKLLTVTIESGIEGLEQAPFIENAFSLEYNPEEEHWRLGIHITDVAHYVAAGSPLNRAARKRGTAIFLGNQILPMLPAPVIQCCSLAPGEDRVAMSIILTIDAQGQVIEYQIEPSVIKVDHHLTYQQIQSYLGNPDDVDSELKEMVEMLNQLFFTLSPLVKAQRIQRGGFQITVPEVITGYKDEGRLGAVVVDPTVPVRALLSELTVLAGKAVAEHLITLDVPSIFCTQPEPDFEELEDLIKLGNNLGLEIELTAEDPILPTNYQHFTQEFSKSSVSKVLHYLLQGTLKPMKYSSHPGKHFGLAYHDCYTHVISPGQRYVDLWLQRLLSAVFAEGRDRRHPRTKDIVDLGSSSCQGQITWKVLPPQLHTDLEDELITLIPLLNDREKEADDAEKDLQGLKKAEKMKERTGQIFQGLITGVQSYGFFVEIEDLLVEGLVHVSSLKDDWYEYRSRHSCLVGRKNRIAYRLGDRVEVEVKSVDYYRQQIDLVTVRGGSNALDDDLEEY